MDRTPLPAPIVLAHRTSLPVLLSVPHSGRAYPDWLIGQSLSGLASLQALEDPLVDRLAWRAIAAGHGAVIAAAPRAAVDCNRAPDEIGPATVLGSAPALVSRRAAAGLGILPARTASHGRLWRSAATRDDFQRRLEEAHAPFHRAIEAGLDAIAARAGGAVLLDCHSMPPRRGQAELVIGNRNGSSAAGWLADAAARIARAAGWSVALNAPYAGGYVVERHGDPQAAIHALQLEIDRRCYLGADLRSPGLGFERSAQLIALLALELGKIVASPNAVAAE
ncbi:MAG TPA: N-formylglutamate amidohydrolase [Sphingomicrobium sp.]|nr:N-formylglutamate amidohydrolase [Sphingomicrobium sp.]